MKLRKIAIENYRGINERIELLFNDFNCIVGKNDAGKSTILKAVDAFLNDNAPSQEDRNIYNASSIIVIELQFDVQDVEVIIDDVIPVSFIDEELVNGDGLLCVKKKWDVSMKTIKPKTYIVRKKYDENDFAMLPEKDLKRMCTNNGIAIIDENGNKGMRMQLRDAYKESNKTFSYIEEELQTTGSTRTKKIFDVLKENFPVFEYFRADKSLSDSDTSVQKYFKDKSFALLKEQIDTNEIENTIKSKIEESLLKISDKINSTLSEDEQISAQVEFDWSKLISTSFKCKKEESSIPLSARGDGFRRITMMSYFEMLAEEKKGGHDMIFGFEEPETFLHPGTQKLLFQKLFALTENDYQVAITTHSPNIVSECDINNIIFVKKEDNYSIIQGVENDIRNIVEELGICSDSRILEVFDHVKCLFLVEGPDDVNAMRHVASIYKSNNKITQTFEELGVVIIPTGGCDSIQHWNTLNTIQQLNKPFFILLDSDKTSEHEDAPNREKLINQKFEDYQFSTLRKREIENYIPSDYFHKMPDPVTNISYGDFDDVKKICKDHPKAVRLGGKKVCEKHFCNLSFEQLRSTFCPDGIDEHDEFIEIYNKINNLITQ